MSLSWRGAVIALAICIGYVSCQNGGASGWSDPRLRSLPRGPGPKATTESESGVAEAEVTMEVQQGGANGWSDPRLRSLPQGPMVTSRGGPGGATGGRPGVHFRGGPVAETTSVDPDIEMREEAASTAHTGEFNALYCSGGQLDMECPPGYNIKIQEGFWGRKREADVCEDGKTLTYNCENRFALQKIKEMCDDSGRCAFNIDGDVFGSNPCYGYNHYLNVTYTCQMPQYKAVSCDGEVLKMECYSGQAITVISAKYGRDMGDASTCSMDGKDSNECSNSGTLMKISQLSNGREWMEIEAISSFFDDSCPNTAKYLTVNYTCAECANAWDNEEDCETWAYEGQCDSNPDWMSAHCRKTCTHCDKAAQCMNTFDGFADLNEQCAQWANEGECYNNAEFMRDNCEKSCADDLCNIWAARGECITGRAWMSQKCARSCNLCHAGMERKLPKSKEVTAWRPKDIPEDLEINVATACYGYDAILSCPAGKHIRVFDGFFGRADASQQICRQINNTDLTMICDKNTGETFQKVSRHCNGRSDCNFLSSLQTLDDACPEKSYYERYLQVHYTCETCENANGDADQCAYWGSWYECQNNAFWMNNNCFQHCSGCSTDGDCRNVESDVDCDFWAIQGECMDNEEFMQLNCAKSCRTCYALDY